MRRLDTRRRAPLEPINGDGAMKDMPAAAAASKETEAQPPDVIYLPDQRQHGRKKITSGSNNRRRRHLERFRTDDAEHTALHARLNGESLGAYVMRLSGIEGGKESRVRRRGRAPVDTVALTQAVAALNRVGNNQNQTTRALNELMLIAREQSSRQLENLVQELADAIRDVPVLLAGPLAAIMAALKHEREG